MIFIGRMALRREKVHQRAMARRNIAIVTGGDTLEAASSAASARNVHEHLDPARFNRFLISVENWKWRLVQADGMDAAQLADARIDLADFTLAVGADRIRFDAAFIAIHGAPAETGHLQAYFELVGLPYTGSGILASALAMDKQSCKHFLAQALGIPTPVHRYVTDGEEAFDPAAPGIAFPCIVKPNSYGSGTGVALVADRQALERAMKRIHALGQDILIEQFICGREFTVGALMLDGKIEILPIAEVFRPDHSAGLHEVGEVVFTDRQSAELGLDPDLPDGCKERLCDLTARIGRAMNCRSFYRVDYMLDRDGGIYFLELNTIPGMTPRSVFTRQMERAGIGQADIYNRIVQDTLARSVAGE